MFLIAQNQLKRVTEKIRAFKLQVTVVVNSVFKNSSLKGLTIIVLLVQNKGESQLVMVHFE